MIPNSAGQALKEGHTGPLGYKWKLLSTGGICFVRESSALLLTPFN